MEKFLFHHKNGKFINSQPFSLKMFEQPLSNQMII